MPSNYSYYLCYWLRQFCSSVPELAEPIESPVWPLIIPNGEITTFKIAYYDEGGASFTGDISNLPTKHYSNKNTNLPIPAKDDHEWRYEDPSQNVIITFYLGNNYNLVSISFDIAPDDLRILKGAYSFYNY